MTATPSIRVAILPFKLSTIVPLKAGIADHKTISEWSTGRELNPRILVLQTSALATSPPVLIHRSKGSLTSEAALRDSLLALGGKILP